MRQHFRERVVDLLFVAQGISILELSVEGAGSVFFFFSFCAAAGETQVQESANTSNKRMTL